MENPYAKIGMALGGLLITVLPVWMDLKGRVDDGKDEQRAHWKIERAHKDSVNKIFQDSVLYLLNHPKKK